MYLFLDIEMGGADLNYSLLTSYFIITDDKFKITHRLDLKTKPDDDKYIVSAQGMSVNKIDLIKHDELAITYKNAGSNLYNFLKDVSHDGKNKLNVVGKGIFGDVEFIQKYLISKGSWEKFTSYHLIDISSITQFLVSCHFLPEKVNGSLEKMAEFFNITVDKNKFHNCQYDTEITYEIYMKLVNMITPHYFKD